MLSNSIRLIVIVLSFTLLLSGCGSNLSQADQQKAYKGFLKKLDATDRPSASEVKDFQITSANANEGKGSKKTAYSAASRLKKMFDKQKDEIALINPPKGFSDEVTQLLKDSKSAMVSANNSKSKAMGSLMKYFNDQKVSDLQAYRYNMVEAQLWIRNSTKNLLNAQMKMGITN